MLKVLRRKSSGRAGAGSGRDPSTSSQLLIDVQQCCSGMVQRALVPDDASVNRAVSNLLDTDDPDVLARVLDFLAAELKSNVHKVVMLTLSTIGFLMRADNAYFQRMLCINGAILKQMSVLIEAKRNARSQEHLDEADLCLQLLQCWAETIQGENDTQEILILYNKLKKRDWIEWPSRNHLYDCDVQIARREVSVDQTAPPPPNKPPSLRPSSLRTFASADTEWMRKDFDNFDALINALGAELSQCSNAHDMEENDLVKELVRECEKIGPQLRSMIEIVSHSTREDPAALQPVLEMNDRLLNVINHYKQLQDTPAKPQKPTGSPKKASPSLLSPPPPSRPKPSPPKAAPPPASYNPFDDEALLAEVFSKLSTTPTSSPLRSPAEKDLMDFSSSPVIQPPPGAFSSSSFAGTSMPNGSAAPSGPIALSAWQNVDSSLIYGQQSAGERTNPFESFGPPPATQSLYSAFDAFSSTPQYAEHDFALYPPDASGFKRAPPVRPVEPPIRPPQPPLVGTSLAADEELL